MSVDLGGGTKEKQARRCGKRAWFVPVSIAEEVTKRTWSSPKALTASCDRCYCRRQSNTTAWIRRKKTKGQESTEKIQRAASSASTRRHQGGGHSSADGGQGEKQEVTHTFLRLPGFASSFWKPPSDERGGRKPAKLQFFASTFDSGFLTKEANDCF